MTTPMMRAFVLAAPLAGGVEEVPAPQSAAGEVVVDVEQVGVCGTDVEFFAGEMAYLHQGPARFPMRLGHEWAGTVAAVGDGVDPAWVGRRVMGDTMLGDGVCRRCRRGTSTSASTGRRSGPAAAATVRWPSRWRSPRRRCTPLFARAAGAEVHLLGLTQCSLAFARSLGFTHTWTADALPDVAFDAVVDASNAAHLPARTLDLVEPAGRVVYGGWPAAPATSTPARSRSRTSRRSGSCPLPRVSRRRSRPTLPARSTPGRWWRRPSGSTRWRTCWPACAPRAPAPDRRSTSTRVSAEGRWPRP